MDHAIRLPEPEIGVGVVASFDFVRDRELWRWAPEHASLFIARTDPVTASGGLSFVTRLGDPASLGRPTREVCAIGARAVIFHCTACGFAGGHGGESALRAAMLAHGAPHALTTAGAAVDALRAVGAGRVAVAHPYDPPVARRLRAFLSEAGFEVVSVVPLEYRPGESVYGVSSARVAELIRAADRPGADAVFLSCTALAAYELIAPIEAELGKPVITANQAGAWAVLRAAGVTPVGPGQRLLSA
jgi:maleate isomerase